MEYSIYIQTNLMSKQAKRNINKNTYNNTSVNTYKHTKRVIIW